MTKESIAAIAFALIAQNALADDTSITKVVKDCVSAVHNTRLSADESYMLTFYHNFDAFYNPATQMIQNNATSVGDQKALFVFNKCMAEHGLPLSYGANK